MKILVTGGAGFIGSHLVDALIDTGYKVVVVDNLVTGKRELVNKKAKFIELDITDRQKLERVFKSAGPFDLVSHLAAQKSVTVSVRDPIFDAEQNIIGGLAMCEAAQKHGVKRLIFSSTGGALYGDGVQLPTLENAKIEPLSPYGIAKYALENYLRFYRTAGMQTQILRYANVYGPRQDPHGEAGVVAIFCRRILQGQDITIFGDGEQTRDFVYVGDIVAANLAALRYPRSGVWNIGTGKETSVNQIARSLLKISGTTKSKIAHQSARLGELKRSCLDNSQVQKDLKWRPQTALAAGLKLTFESFK